MGEFYSKRVPLFSQTHCNKVSVEVATDYALYLTISTQTGNNTGIVVQRDI